MSKIRIIGQEQKDRACEMIQALDPSNRMLVEIRNQKENRSLAQNGLYFTWVTFLAGEEGHTKEEMHKLLKSRFLSGIYQRDKPEFAELVESIREVWRSGSPEMAKKMMDGVNNLISIKDADIDQFREYLDDIDKDALQRGINLIRPDEMYREAMGN